MKAHLLSLIGVALLFGGRNLKRYWDSKEAWWTAETMEDAGYALLGAPAAKVFMATLGERKAVRKRRKRAKPSP